MVRYKTKNNLPTLRTELKYAQVSLKTIQVNSVQKTPMHYFPKFPKMFFQNYKKSKFVDLWDKNIYLKK